MRFIVENQLLMRFILCSYVIIEFLSLFLEVSPFLPYISDNMHCLCVKVRIMQVDFLILAILAVVLVLVYATCGLTKVLAG